MVVSYIYRFEWDCSVCFSTALCWLDLSARFDLKRNTPCRAKTDPCHKAQMHQDGFDRRCSTPQFLARPGCLFLHHIFMRSWDFMHLVCNEGDGRFGTFKERIIFHKIPSDYLDTVPLLKQNTKDLYCQKISILWNIFKCNTYKLLYKEHIKKRCVVKSLY